MTTYIGLIPNAQVVLLFFSRQVTVHCVYTNLKLASLVSDTS